MALQPDRQSYNAQVSVDRGYPTGKVVRKRASKACRSCRQRKVRCSVVKSGIPCSNCRSDDLHCTVSVSRRRKRFLTDGIVSEDDPVLPSGRSHRDPASAIEPLDSFLATAPTSLDFKLSDHVTHVPDDEIEQTSCTNIWIPSPSSAHIQPINFMTTPRPSSAASLLNISKAQVILPNFVNELPLHLGWDDIEFLERRGVFKLPSTEFRNELLRCYVQFVHPLLPFLDLNDFLGTINRNDSSSRTSLMLFHAVMLSAAAFVDIGLLKSEGYETRKAARKTYFEKAKLLYHFDYDSNRVSTVQALVLLTYWYETPDDLKDPSHWIGTCLSYAYAVGLHRKAEHANFDPKERKMRKRLWWSCFMRERLIAISMRKPTHIRRDDYDIPMLTMEDLDTPPLSQDLIGMLGDCSVESDLSTRTILAKLCIEKARLCVCIADVLATQYHALGNRIGATAEATMMIMPKRSASESYDFIKCEQGLNLWYGNLPKDCRYTAPENSISISEITRVHRATVSMVYSATLSALHRPRIISKLPSQVVAKNFQQLSRQRVREAAINISEIAQDLHCKGLIRFLPPVAVTVLVPAIILHILDMRSNQKTVRDTGLRRYYQCMNVLQQLREMYYSADAAFLFLDAAIKRLNISLPKAIAEPESVFTNPLVRQENFLIRGSTIRVSAPFPVDLSYPVNSHENPVSSPTLTISPLSADPPSPSDLDTDGLSSEDLVVLNYFNMWPHMFEAESGLNLDPDVDWAMDFSTCLTPGSSINPDKDARYEFHTEDIENGTTNFGV